MKATLQDDRGIAMVVVIAIMAILLSITGAALLLGGLNLKTASNLKTGGGAMHAADAGVQHALAIIPQGLNFTYAPNTNTPVVDATVFPDANSGYSYTVTATNNPSTSSSSSTAILTSTATGPNGTKRVVRAYIARTGSSWVPPGTVFIPGANTSHFDFDVNGTSYTITGNDTNYDNTSGSGAAITGISSPNSNVVTNINNALDTDSKRQRIAGAGYAAGPPVTPSVQTTTRTDDVNAIAQNFVNQITSTSCPPKCTNGLQWDLNSCPSSSPCTLGTDAAPQITYIKGETRMQGYVNGSGVLILEGQSELKSYFNFHGLVIQKRGSDSELESHIRENAKIYGALMLGPNNTTELKFEIDESGAIRYSSTAINMVNSNWGSCCLPGPAKVIAWAELMQ